MNKTISNIIIGISAIFLVMEIVLSFRVSSSFLMLIIPTIFNLYLWMRRESFLTSEAEADNAQLQQFSNLHSASSYQENDICSTRRLNKKQKELVEELKLRGFKKAESSNFEDSLLNFMKVKPILEKFDLCIEVALLPGNKASVSSYIRTLDGSFNEDSSGLISAFIKSNGIEVNFSNNYFLVNEICKQTEVLDKLTQKIYPNTREKVQAFCEKALSTCMELELTGI